MRITTVSSGRMTTQALTSGRMSAACAAARPHGTRKPSDRPPPIAAALARSERRLTCRARLMARPPYPLPAAPAVFSAGQPDRLGQHPEQRGARIDIRLETLAIDIDRHHRRPPLSLSPHRALDQERAGFSGSAGEALC